MERGPGERWRAGRSAGRYHTPWQDLVAAEVDRLLDEFGSCLIIDAHSFLHQPLSCELDRDLDSRPDICLGWDDFHGPAALQRSLIDRIERAGFSVLVNRPFAGSFVPLRHFERDARVRSVMVEVNRRLYWDGARGEVDQAMAVGVRKCLKDIVRLFAAASEATE